MIRRKQKESTWIALSDMMTSLMLIFLLIAIVFMWKAREYTQQIQSQIQQIQAQNAVKEKVVVDYSESRELIYADLKKVFSEKEKEWNMTIDRGLTIKFLNPDVLFDAKQSTLQPEFKRILDEFIPKYLSVVTRSEYVSKIKEVRIEGHVEAWCLVGQSRDERWPIACYDFSQDRANAVLRYLLENKTYVRLPESDKKQLTFILTANGMGAWRTLDSNGDLSYLSGRPPNGAKSRRVEFKIVTDSEALYEQIKNTK